AAEVARHLYGPDTNAKSPEYQRARRALAAAVQYGFATEDGGTYTAVPPGPEPAPEPEAPKAEPAKNPVPGATTYDDIIAGYPWPADRAGLREVPGYRMHRKNRRAGGYYVLLKPEPGTPFATWSPWVAVCTAHGTHE